MSTTAEPGVARSDEPQPWQSSEDAQGWRTLPRTRGQRGRAPLISVTVDLDAAQSEWLRAEAKRTGLGYDELLLQLIESRRSGGAG
jgi:hypothetical protein